MGVLKAQVKQGVKGQASDEMKTSRPMGRDCVGVGPRWGLSG